MQLVYQTCSGIRYSEPLDLRLSGHESESVDTVLEAAPTDFFERDPNTEQHEDQSESPLPVLDNLMKSVGRKAVKPIHQSDDRRPYPDSPNSHQDKLLNQLIRPHIHEGEKFSHETPIVAEKETV